MRLAITYAVAAGIALGLAGSALHDVTSSSIHAGTALRMDLEEVFRRSDVVVEATVVDSRCLELEDGAIVTDWELEVDRTFWGDAEPVRTIRLPGGLLASGRGMVIPGMPRIAVHENVVLLLGPESNRGVRLPTGLGQGKYRVITSADGTRTAVQTGDHMTLISAARLGSPRGLAQMDHGELVARLEAARAQRLAADAFGTPSPAPSGDAQGR